MNDRDQALADADAHLSLARSALKGNDWRLRHVARAVDNARKIIKTILAEEKRRR